MSEIPMGQAYNSWWQFRLDMWSRLEEASGRLATAAARGSATDDLAKTVADLLDGLTPLEPFWAFPGSQAYRRARDFFESLRYDRFERIVVRINRALVTESYRDGRGWTVIEGDHEKVDTEGMVSEPTRTERPLLRGAGCRDSHRRTRTESARGGSQLAPTGRRIRL